MKPAQALREYRHQLGASRSTARSAARLHRRVVTISPQRDHNRAAQLIEDFHDRRQRGDGPARCAAPGVSSIRRVVKSSPSAGRASWSWPLNSARNCPPRPIPARSNAFSCGAKRPTPCTSPISLSRSQLMGPGEYVLMRPGDPTGHFGLGRPRSTPTPRPRSQVRDLLTQRLLKALAAKAQPPYSDDGADSIRAALQP